MIADLHCHYPMHLLVEESGGGAPRDLTRELITSPSDHDKWRDKLRAAAVRLLAGPLNFRLRRKDNSDKDEPEWRVSFDRLEQGDVRLVFSVLYDPIAEIDPEKWIGASPDDRYYGALLKLLRDVETDLDDKSAKRRRHLIVKTAADLDTAVDERLVAIVHAVEGGFHLGANLGEIDGRVKELASRGVGYITLAHLFWRRVATNEPAIPFIPTPIYKAIFRQPRGAALGPIGEEAVRAMYKHRVLIDLSHMREDAMAETFDLLKDLDHESGADPKDFPVIASHAGYRFGRQTYMLSPETIRKIAARDGVIGLILAHHQLDDHVPATDATGFDKTMHTIASHVTEIEKLTKSLRHVGIGSDLDGFIKPTVEGIDYVDDLQKLRGPLEKAFPGNSEAILHGNTERVLRKVLDARPRTATA